jgi:UDP-N-acetylglucosamine--dolichyl-phosphate N-acetylglucosaminephosphotransferase
MSLLSTFSTNSINILAGINGSEVSQALIIAISVALNDFLYLPWPQEYRITLPLHVSGNTSAQVEVGGSWAAGMAYGSEELVQRHLFSLYFMLPLIGVCAGFLYHNWYVILRIAENNVLQYAGIRHERSPVILSATLLAWRSLSSAFKATFPRRCSCSSSHKSSILCYRVRNCLVLFPVHATVFRGKLIVVLFTYCFLNVPIRFEASTNLLHPSKAQFLKPPKPLSVIVLKLFAALGLTELTIDPKTRQILEVTNLTILNYFLLRLGPLSEKTLVKVLMTSQVCSKPARRIVC